MLIPQAGTLRVREGAAIAVSLLLSTGTAVGSGPCLTAPVSALPLYFLLSSPSFARLQMFQ